MTLGPVRVMGAGVEIRQCVKEVRMYGDYYSMKQ